MPSPSTSREPRSGKAAAAAGSLSRGLPAPAARCSRQGQQPCRGSQLSHHHDRGPAAAPALSLVLLCLACGPAASAAHLPSCRPVFTNGEFTIPTDCVWPEQQTVPAKRVTIQAVQTPRALGNLPAVNLAVDADTGTAAGRQGTVVLVCLHPTRDCCASCRNRRSRTAVPSLCALLPVCHSLHPLH